MTQFIISIVGDVLRHVAVQVLKRQVVGWISSYEFLELLARLCGSSTGRPDSAEFLVLGPQITLYNFGPRRELQECNIAFRKLARAGRGLRCTFSRQQCTG